MASKLITLSFHSPLLLALSHCLVPDLICTSLAVLNKTYNEPQPQTKKTAVANSCDATFTFYK